MRVLDFIPELSFAAALVLFVVIAIGAVCLTDWNES